MRTFTPSDLGLSAIDLKTLATSTSTLKIPAEDFFQFSVHMLMTFAAGTPTTGLATLGANLYTGPAGATALASVPGTTSVDTKGPTATSELFTFGGAGAGSKLGTLSLGASALKVVKWIELFVIVTEVVDVVATATADIYMEMDGYRR